MLLINQVCQVLGGVKSVPPHRDRLSGTVTVDGLPARRTVIALYRSTLSYVAAATSDPVTGAWELSGLPEYPERSLLVLALDNTGNYNAEIADYISQVTG